MTTLRIVQQPDGTVIAYGAIAWPGGGLVNFASSVNPKAIEAFLRSRAAQQMRLLLAMSGVRLEQALAVLNARSAQEFLQRLHEKIPEAAQLMAVMGAEVGVTAPGAREWWWHATSARYFKLDPNDRSPQAMAVQDRWWNGMSPDERENARAAFLGITQNPEFARNPPAGNAWWGSLSPNRRTQIRHRYRPGLHNVTRVVKDVAAPIVDAVKVALPIASMIMPALAPLGALAAPALNLVSRAMKGDPVARKAVSAITQAAQAGNPQAQQTYKALAFTLNQVQQFKPPPGAAAGGAAPIGDWVTATGGQMVYRPAGTVGGPALDALWETVRPRYGYRAESDVFGIRDMYRTGLAAMYEHVQQPS